MRKNIEILFTDCNCNFIMNLLIFQRNQEVLFHEIVKCIALDCISNFIQFLETTLFRKLYIFRFPYFAGLAQLVEQRTRNA